MHKIIFTFFSLAIFILFSCSQPKTVLKDVENPSPSSTVAKESPVSKSLTNQELAVDLYEATHKVELSSQEKTAIFSSTSENLLAWQKVLENYSGNSDVDSDYIKNLVSGMKSKLKL